MKIMLLLGISILPVILIGSFIYNKDKQKEPTKLLVKLFLGGILSCVLTIAISLILEAIFPIFGAEPKDLNLYELFIYTFIGIALIEEFSKWLITYRFSYDNESFDEFYDMILYCVFVALGFACIENILYVFQNGVGAGILRAVSAVPGHVCDGVFMGYYLGISKMHSISNNKSLKNKNIALSLIVPTITHGIYDYCLFSGSLAFFGAFVFFIIVMYIIAFKKIKHISTYNKSIMYKNNYCTNCGTKLEGNYCTECGKKKGED